MCRAYRSDVIAQIKAFDWNFTDHGDEQLVEMFRAAKVFCFDLCMSILSPDKHPSYWLTFLGASETGKTHLAHGIYRFFKQHVSETFIPVLGFKKRQLEEREGEFHVATEIGKDAIQQHGLLRRLSALNLLIIDELDPNVSKLEKDQVCKLISWRSGAGTTPFKWTVMTSNLTREQVATELDPRIASRLRRENNVIIDLAEDITAHLDRS